MRQNNYEPDPLNALAQLLVIAFLILLGGGLFLGGWGAAQIWALINGGQY